MLRTSRGRIISIILSGLRYHTSHGRLGRSGRCLMIFIPSNYSNLPETLESARWYLLGPIHTYLGLGLGDGPTTLTFSARHT